MSIYILRPLSSSSNPLHFLRCPAIFLLVHLAHRHHISVTPESLPPFHLCHLSNTLSLHLHPTPTSLYHSSIFIYISVYIFPLTHFLYPLSLNNYLSLSIYPQPLSLPASYSPYHSLLLNSPSYHSITLYLSHTNSITIYAFYVSSAPPISVMPCVKLDSRR